jgi:hypothetical protein
MTVLWENSSLRNDDWYQSYFIIITVEPWYSRGGGVGSLDPRE